MYFQQKLVPKSMKQQRSASYLFYAVAVVCISLSGCLRPYYQYGTPRALGSPAPRGTSPIANPISVGGDHPRIDKLEKIVQAPARFFKRFAKPDDTDQRSDEQRRMDSLELSLHYLQRNELSDVNIDVRRYEPREQWRRLKANQRIAPIWKYSVGTLGVVGYAIFPGRALHNDQYDPFTNTLSINSTDSTIAFYEAAQAKVYRNQRWPGTHAALQHAPIVPLIHHAEVSSDALTYARVHDDWKTEKELYPHAYANAGSSIAGNALFFVPRLNKPFYIPMAIDATASAAGGMLGERAAKLAERERANLMKSRDPTTTATRRIP